MTCHGCPSCFKTKGLCANTNHNTSQSYVKSGGSPSDNLDNTKTSVFEIHLIQDTKDSYVERGSVKQILIVNIMLNILKYGITCFRGGFL